MLPIYKEYIQYLHNNNIDIDIEEGKYWIDNYIIKGFDKEGKLRCLYKILVDDELNVSYKPFNIPKKIINNGLETWVETIDRYNDRLNYLEALSLNKICNKCKSLPDYKRIILNSTGKDSALVQYLCDKTNIEFETYFTNTTIEYGDSVKIAKENNYIFMHPTKYKSFTQWQKETNIIPTKLHRVCCSYFKETTTITNFDKKDKILFLLGMRHDESVKRSKYDYDYKNPMWGIRRQWEGLLPILEWNELELWLYIIRENIEINPLYHKGYERVGCINSICPYSKKKNWALDKYWYPIIFNKWQNIIREDFIKNNKWLATNMALKEYMTRWNHSEVPDSPSKECIEEFANYNNIDKELAKEFFVNKCNECGKPIRHKYEIGMCMKYGLSKDKYLCKKCFMEKYNFTKEEYNKRIEIFKTQECDLF